MRPSAPLRLLAPLSLLAAIVVPTASGAATPLTISVVSNRADLVSGGDALVRIQAPRGTPTSAVTVLLASRDITRSFVAKPGGQLLGRVPGLAVGRNRIVARAPGSASELIVTNHPRGGPVFTGPQMKPWFCHTEEAGLGVARDAQCNAPTVFTYQYRNAVT